MKNQSKIRHERMRGTPLSESMPDPCVFLTLESMEAFLERKRVMGKTESTIKNYRAVLTLLRKYLPEDGRIIQDTLKDWKDYLIEHEYAIDTINRCLSVANNMVDFLGHREFQIIQYKRKERPKDVLTRNEYLRMLQTARKLNAERTYFLIKCFANMDLPLQESNKLTVEALKSGNLTVLWGTKEKKVWIPANLRQELLAYAERHGIVRGSIFVTKRGKPMRRTQISGDIHCLCSAAKVDERKGSPQGLKGLYNETMKSIYSNMDNLIHHAYEQMLEREQIVPYTWSE